MFETKSKNYFVVWELAFKCETNCVTQQMISGEGQMIRHLFKNGCENLFSRNTTEGKVSLKNVCVFKKYRSRKNI